jgi:hypothetical protein
MAKQHRKNSAGNESSRNMAPPVAAPAAPQPQGCRRSRAACRYKKPADLPFRFSFDLSFGQVCGSISAYADRLSFHNEVSAGGQLRQHLFATGCI